MRRDRERVKLIRVFVAEVGERGMFVIDLDVPGGALTNRRTTPIVSIDRIADNASAVHEVS